MGGRARACSVCITRKRAVSSETELSFFTLEFLERHPHFFFFLVAPIEKSREERPLLPHPKGEEGKNIQGGYHLWVNSAARRERSFSLAAVNERRNMTAFYIPQGRQKIQV